MHRTTVWFKFCCSVTSANLCLFSLYFLSYILCLFSPKPRSILDPKMLGLQSVGWVVAHFLIRSLYIYTLLSCCVFCTPPYWGAGRGNVKSMLFLWHTASLWVLCSIWHTTESKFIYKMPYGLTTSATELKLFEINCAKLIMKLNGT